MTPGPDGARLVVVHQTAGVPVWDLPRIRAQLAEMGLDRDRPPLPACRHEAGGLRVEVVSERTEEGAGGSEEPTRRPEGTR
jgi:hypothetical protein